MVEINTINESTMDEATQAVKEFSESVDHLVLSYEAMNSFMDKHFCPQVN